MNERTNSDDQRKHTLNAEDNFGLNDTTPVEDTAAEQTAEVSPEEWALLDAAGQDEKERTNLEAANLDNTDDDGEALNEGITATDLSGADLDVPGSAADDANELIGEEDEENNSYSLGADKKD